MALTATTYADTIHRWIGSATETIKKTFYAAAATSYTKGDFVTIGTDGTVSVNATDGAAIDGIVDVTVDNTDGAAGDLFVSVLVKGNVWADGLFSATGGDFDDVAAIGTQMGVAGDSGTTAAEGQALVGTPGGAGNQQFTSLSIHVLPSAGNELVKMLAFFEGNAAKPLA